MKTIPNYHPPQDYRRPTKTQEKVYVPVNDYPEINFSEIANPLTFLTMPFSPSCSGFRQEYSFRSIRKVQVLAASNYIPLFNLQRVLTLSSSY